MKKTKIKVLDLLISLLIVAGVFYLGYRIKVGLNYTWNWQVIPQYLVRYDQAAARWVTNLLLHGLFTTVRLSVWGTILATILGTIVGLSRISQPLFYRLLGRSYVEFVRNMPPLVLIFIFYYFVSGQIMPVLGLDEFILSRSTESQWLCGILFAPPAFFSRSINFTGKRD